jgi:hypothetical protein
VLSQEEVRRILARVHTPHNYAFLATVYACGLRLTEPLKRRSWALRLNSWFGLSLLPTCPVFWPAPMVGQRNHP